MAKYHRKAPARERIEVKIEGEPCALVVRRANTRELLELAAAAAELRRVVAPGAGLDPVAYGQLVTVLERFVIEVEGVEDEDGAAVQWDALTADERAHLMLALELASVMEAFAQLARAGRLGLEQKKASEATSAPSSVASGAAAPSASEASLSPA